MKRLGFGLVFIIIIALGVLFIVPSLIPSETYKTHIEAQLNSELGRDVTIEGDVRLSTFPTIKAIAGQTHLSNPPGFSNENLATLESLEARIKLWPLLSRRIEIASFNLIGPDIRLERLANGQNNWSFGDLNAGNGKPEVDPVAENGPFQRDGRFSNIDPSLGSFRIINGQISYQDQQNDVRHTLTDIDIRLALPNMTDQLSLNGNMTIDGEPVTLDILLDSPRAFLDGQAADFSGDIDLRGLSVKAAGSFPAGTDIGFDGQVEATLSDTALIKSFLTDPIPALELIRKAEVSARLESKNANIGTTFSDVIITAGGETFDAEFSGNGAYHSTLSLDGTYAVNARDLPTILNILDIDQTGAEAVSTATINGMISFNEDRLISSNTQAKLFGPDLNAEFSGTVSQQGETIDVNGDFSGDVPSLSALSTNSDIEIPYANLIGQIETTGQISGQIGNLTLSNLRLGMTNGDLNGAFSGQARVKDTVSLDGSMTVSGASLRKIASQTGTVLPSATDEGPIFEAFEIKGNIQGPLDNIIFRDVAASLDTMQASGEFGVSLREERPLLTGTLTTGELDLQPYMAAYSADAPDSGPIPPWSEEVIPTESLRAIDANLSLGAASIALPRLRLGPTRADATLIGGRLAINVPKTDLYGGSGRAALTLDGSGDTLIVDMSAGLNKVEAQGFLGAVAGLTQATGTAETSVSLRGSGLSQAAIMQSLTGDGSFQIVDGSLRGIDATEFMTGLQQAFTNRTLPGGIGQDKVTQFRNLIGGFSLVDGVAQIQSFKITAPQVQLEGAGQVDLGNQTVDIRLRPKAVGPDATGLAAFGIPLRIRGPFGSSVINLDTEFLGQIIQARAAQQAQKAITDRLGGTAGGGLGSILGSTPRSASNPAETTSNLDKGETDTQEPETAEETAKETSEEKLENSLRDLFGVKRRD